MTIRLQFPLPHYRIRKPQSDLHKACDKFEVVWGSGGVGSGKSVWLINQAREFATILAPGGTGIYGVPITKTFWRVVVPRLHSFWPKGSFSIDSSQSDLKILVPCGDKTTTIWVCSANDIRTLESQWEGPDIDFCLLDEPSSMLHGQGAFNKALARMRGRTGPRNCMAIAGKPKGLNWIAQAFGIEHEHPPEAWTTGYSPKPGYYVRCLRTTDNPTLRPDYYQRLVDAYGETFAKQELEGQIVAMEGRVLPNFYPSLHLIPPKLAQQLYDRTHYRTGGVDWGFRNPAAICHGGWDGDGNRITPPGGCWYRTGRSAEQMLEVAEKLQNDKHTRVSEWHCGPDRPENIHKWKYGVDITLPDGRRRRIQVHGVKRGINEPEARYDCLRSALDLRGIGVLDHPGKAPGNKLGRPGWLISETEEDIKKEALALRYAEVRPGEIVPRDKVEGHNHSIEAEGYDQLAYQRQYALKPQQV